MTAFRTEFEVQWGDCDAAGIVFYPNYFYWMDSTFQRLLASRGLGQRELQARFGAVTPLVDVGLAFKSPVTFGQILTIDVTLTEWQERRLRLDYRIECEGRLAAEGHEVRAWALTGGEKLKGAPVPDEFRKMLT
ncbi:acyl-CoA thioesterase [Aureimonas sp. D3]|uniref:acyl-CoA thioesterase n=1 Tax=Aureimonas sp. D3 TaxID=1638164 RepID=UPI00078566A1|nr:acyl-CoA thioesterase [Aureimonas sp. D3]